MSAKRTYGSWGIEHVVIKGNNGMTVFKDDKDCNYFMNLLHSKQEKSTILISYVLMNNHVHLILKENSPDKISNLIMKVCGTYSTWFNQKHGRSNALFRHRFYNESIEEEAHLLNAIHYIHNNPVKARLVSHPQYYKWSSYNEYNGDEKYIDKSVYKKYFNNNDYIFDESQICTGDERSELYYKNHEYFQLCLQQYLSQLNIASVDQMLIEERAVLIKKLYKEKGFTYSTISDLFKISRGAIWRILN